MLIQSDAARIPLPDNSAHCVVTSPPYWGLRKYKGNDDPGSVGLETLFDCGAWKQHFPEWRLKFGDDGKVIKYIGRKPELYAIELCGECHVCRMVAVGRSVYRTLRSDGTFWLNYGDCFVDGHLAFCAVTVAKALVADGWLPRNDDVWNKGNPMPESVAGWSWQDDRLRRSSWRHTRAHEYVFQLVKGMQYWSNQEAVREGIAESTQNDYRLGWYEAGRPERDYPGQPQRGSGLLQPNPSGRNPRSVLDVPTAPYSGAHYATFPPSLIAPLIRATCPRWACPTCGQGWAPVVEQSYRKHRPSGGKKTRNERGNKASPETNWGTFGTNLRLISNVLDYRPTCSHPHTKAEAVPGVVLDPFVGSGTTVMVANNLLRRGVGLDISMPYLDQQAKVRTGIGTPADELKKLPLFQPFCGGELSNE